MLQIRTIWLYLGNLSTESLITRLGFRMIFDPMPVDRGQQVALLVGMRITYFAMSCFWQIQISSDSALTRFKNCLRATKRPGLPMI